MAPKAVAGYCAGAAQNVTTNGDVEIMDGTHTLAGGTHTGDTLKLVTGTSATKYINYFPKDPLVTMINIAKVKGDATNSQLVIVGIEKGTMVYANGSETSPTLPLKARVSIVGINSEANAYMTEATWTLTKAGVAWVMQNPTDARENNGFVNEFRLEQNYPNPFNPTTTIRYQTSSNSGIVSLRVFDVLGNLVSTLVNQEQSAGAHELQFNASTLPSGTYFYELRANNFRSVQKMVLMK
jgi:hypothetical protein